MVAALATLSLMAQDLIITRDSKRIEAKITEVSSSEIRYLEWNNQSGPVFVLRTDEINSIIYQNGNVTTFEHAATSAPTYNNNNAVNYSNAPLPVGYIVKDDNDIYTVGNLRMSESQYVDFIRQNCKEAYDYYDSGISLWSSGWKLFGMGVGLVLGGTVWWCLGWYLFTPYSSGSDYTTFRALTIGGYVLWGVGGLAMTGSVPCLIVGGIRKNNSHEIYNESCARQQSEVVSFGLQPSPGGLGLAIKF